MKKLSRLKLKNIKGASNCVGCPVNNTYGNTPEFSNTCDQFLALSENCKRCVDVAYDCEM